MVMCVNIWSCNLFWNRRHHHHHHSETEVPSRRQHFYIESLLKKNDTHVMALNVTYFLFHDFGINILKEFFKFEGPIGLGLSNNASDFYFRSDSIHLLHPSLKKPQIVPLSVFAPQWPEMIRIEDPIKNPNKSRIYICGMGLILSLDQKSLEFRNFRIFGPNHPHCVEQWVHTTMFFPLMMSISLLCLRGKLAIFPNRV